MRKIFTLLILLLTIPLCAQQAEEQDPITVALTDYMEGRQAIHLHLNKDRYFTGESIWFSAYLFDLGSGKISQEDSNLNVFLMDEHGKVLAKSLLISENGRAHGEFLISPEQEGSVLYIKAFVFKSFERARSVLQIGITYLLQDSF